MILKMMIFMGAIGNKLSLGKIWGKYLEKQKIFNVYPKVPLILSYIYYTSSHRHIYPTYTYVFIYIHIHILPTLFGFIKIYVYPCVLSIVWFLGRKLGRSFQKKIPNILKFPGNILMKKLKEFILVRFRKVQNETE